MTQKPEKVRVLFVCIGNACRSPMAEAIARQDAGDILEPSSAGIFPLGMVPEMTLQTLTLNGYASEGLRSKAIRTQDLLDADLVINLSGHMKPAALSGSAEIEDWPVADPYGEDAEIYQTILEVIRKRIEDLATRLRKKCIEP